MAAIFFCAALAIAFAALRVSLTRSQALEADLSAGIARIKSDGEAVERQIRQLAAVRSARASRNDLSRVAAGLVEATPPEVTYSQIELTETGRLRLLGQATSLSMPFLMPERLEKQPAFRDVMLYDAGQQKRAEGSVAEFRIECNLRRGPRP
jgi:hypothetical protein